MPQTKPDIDNQDFDANNFQNYAINHGFGDVHIKFDRKTGLHAIIAIHSTKFGPSLGGCRYISYDNFFAAIYDAMRLARGMSYKAAALDLPLGGGKSVILKPNEKIDEQAYFTSFANFVNGLCGRYITAPDSGSTTQIMDIIAQTSKHVVGTSNQGDPSGYTAQGICRGIEAAIKFKTGKESLKDIHIAIQGIGKVGFELAKLLANAGARLTISDVNQTILEECKTVIPATIVPPNQIHQVECDVYAPCALGASINSKNIHEIKAPIIAGAANNQLEHHTDGQLLHQRGILYAPDYVVNAGGLIYAAASYGCFPIDKTDEKINNIYNSLLAIFKRSQAENKPTNYISDQMAEEKLAD